MAENTNYASELRIVVFGKDPNEKKALSDLITRNKDNHSLKATTKSTVTYGEWRKMPLTLIETSDVFNLPEDKVKHELKKCVALCPPGPNVLLLLLNSTDFNKQDRQKLMFILSFFGQDTFKYSMAIETQHMEVNNSSVNQVIQDIGQRQHIICLDEKDLPMNDYQALMSKMETIVHDNKGGHLNCAEQTNAMTISVTPKPPMNLVLCGRFRAWKTAVARAILDERKEDAPGNRSDLMTMQGEACGRQISLVELPALHGKSQKVAMEQSIRCISHCHPHGVHAFILVLPMGPLSEEDEMELEAMQNIFTSQVNDFIMIVVAVKSNPNSPAVIKFLKENQHIHKLCQSCEDQYFVFNLTDKQQVFHLIHSVEEMRAGESRCFTKGMMAPGLESELSTAEYEHQTTESLRMVLIGKTGCGKSATGNTILNKQCFKSTTSLISVTSCCQKAVGEVDGRSVTVVDTPGLYDTELSNGDIETELGKCVSLLSPGPHVFLLVMRIGRFTEEERDTVEKIKTFFGKNSKNFIIFIFTRGDELQDQTIENFIEQDRRGSIKSLIAECGGFYQVINNKDPDRAQVRELLNKVDSIVKKNGGNWYTSEMFEQAEAAIQREMNRILKEEEDEIQRKEKEIERKYKEEIEAKKKEMAERITKTELEGAKIKQKRDYIKKEQQKMQREEEERREWESTMKGQDEDERIQREEQYRQRRQEEETKLEKLREEYQKEKEKHNKQKKEDQLRKEREEKLLKELQDNLTENLTIIKRKHEEEARKQAEEINEFRRKYTVDFASLVEKHDEEIEDLRQKRQKHNEHIITQLRKHKAFDKDFNKLKKKQQQEINNMKETFHKLGKENLDKEMQDIQRQHDEEVNEWIQEHVMKAGNKLCSIL